MDGNRGAKGSVKDRLISMLYRLRYKKKKLKEEDYTISNKEKQENYLYTLQNFYDKENADILDEIERKELDSIEFKTDELDEKVDLKKEIKKTKNEITILEEVDIFIKNSLINIDDIQNELQEIKSESKEKNKDTKKIEERYKALKEKINKLKLQYDTIRDKYDLSEFSILESIKLMDNVTEYTNVARLNEVEMMLKVCKKEINKMDSITVIVEENKKVGIDIKNTKEEQKKVKIKFNKSKEKINKINSFEEKLAYEIKTQQQIVDDMYKKASYFEKEISKRVELIGQRNILGSLFRIAGGILTLPFTGRQSFGVSLGSTLINKGLKGINRSLETKEKIVVNYKYEDISKQIEQVKDKVEYTNLIICDSLNEIKKLRNNFKNIYSNYNNILPEYNLTLNKLNDLEYKLLEQQKKLINMNKKLEEEKKINKQKMKKISK